MKCCMCHRMTVYSLSFSDANITWNTYLWCFLFCVCSRMALKWSNVWVKILYFSIFRILWLNNWLKTFWNILVQNAFKWEPPTTAYICFVKLNACVIWACTCRSCKWFKSLFTSRKTSLFLISLLRITSFACFILVPSIKTEPIDDYDPALICNTVHSGLGTVTQPYYSQHTMVTESPSCLVATMAPCQQLRSGLSSPDSRYHQQNPAAVVYQRSKSLSPSQLGYQQSSLMATPVAISDAHRSVLVHTGSPGQTSAVLHHSPGNQQSSPVIHYSPTNQQLRCGSHQEFQHIMCCENFTSSVARPSQPQVSQAQRLSPSSYPTVIQQQTASGQRAAKNGPPVSDQKEVLPAGVTIKQEQNLDQAYLDDGKHHSSPVWVWWLEGGVKFVACKSHLFLGTTMMCTPSDECVHLLFAHTSMFFVFNQLHFWYMTMLYGYRAKSSVGQKPSVLLRDMEWAVRFQAVAILFPFAKHYFGKWRNRNKMHF